MVINSDIVCLSLSCQMAVKMGNEQMSHLNSSSAGVEASLYYSGQKRPGDDAGESGDIYHSHPCFLVLTEQLCRI